MHSSKCESYCRAVVVRFSSIGPNNLLQATGDSIQRGVRVRSIIIAHDIFAITCHDVIGRCVYRREMHLERSHQLLRTKVTRCIRRHQAVGPQPRRACRVAHHRLETAPVPVFRCRHDARADGMEHDSANTYAFCVEAFLPVAPRGDMGQGTRGCYPYLLYSLTGIYSSRVPPQQIH